MYPIKLYIFLLFSLVSLTTLAQTVSNENVIKAFSEWCRGYGPKAELSASSDLLTKEKCSCIYYNSDAGITEGHSFEVFISRLKNQVEDAGTLLGTQSANVNGNHAQIVSFYYEILGQAIATISWSQDGIYHSLKFTQNYPPGYVREEAPGKASEKAIELANSMSRKNGIHNILTGNLEKNKVDQGSNAQTDDRNVKKQAPNPIPPSKTETAEDSRPAETKRSNKSISKRPSITPKTEPSSPSPRPQPPDLNVGLKVSVGLMGGITTNGLLYDFGLGIETNSLRKIGFMAGMLLDVRMSNLFSLQLPISWKIKGEEAEASFIYNLDHQYDGFNEAVDGIGTIKHQLNYIEIPLVFNFSFSTGKNYLSFGVGPYMAKGLGGMEENNYEFSIFDDDFYDFSSTVTLDRVIEFTNAGYLNDMQTKYLASWDYGIYGQLSYKVNRFMIGATLSYGLIDINLSDEWTTEFGSLYIPEVKTLSAGIFLAYFLK